MGDDRLDTLLSLYRATEPAADLRDRIVAAAPRQRAIGRAWQWISGAGVGLALVTSCVAGVAAGLTLAPAGVTQLIGGHPTGADLSSLADPADDPAIS
jgi:hypothetical protein